MGSGFRRPAWRCWLAETHPERQVKESAIVAKTGGKWKELFQAIFNKPAAHINFAQPGHFEQLALVSAFP